MYPIFSQGFPETQVESVGLNFTGCTNFGKACGIVLIGNMSLCEDVYLQIHLPALKSDTTQIRWVNDLQHRIITKENLNISSKDKTEMKTKSSDAEKEIEAQSRKLSCLTKFAKEIPETSLLVPLRTHIAGHDFDSSNGSYDIVFANARDLIECESGETYPDSVSMRNCQAWADFKTHPIQ